MLVDHFADLPVSYVKLALLAVFLVAAVVVVVVVSQFANSFSVHLVVVVAVVRCLIPVVTEAVTAIALEAVFVLMVSVFLRELLVFLRMVVADSIEVGFGILLEIEEPVSGIVVEKTILFALLVRSFEVEKDFANSFSFVHLAIQSADWQPQLKAMKLFVLQHLKVSVFVMMAAFDVT